MLAVTFNFLCDGTDRSVDWHCHSAPNSRATVWTTGRQRRRAWNASGLDM